ncbi:MAG: hypothetical protein IPK80_00445 [Nannocystis sp.]|nr:hypothetical protein [Nannocystis sp.]
MSTTGYRSTSPLHGLLSGLLSAAIVCSTLIPCAQARAADGSVLDLEGDDKAKVAALSKALRGQFAARGIGGGKEMSAIEFKLTMGCDDPPEPRCMANGGKSLGVGQLVYGSLKGKGPSYQVELVLVDVGSGSVTKSHNATIEASGLEAGAIEATAKGLVEAMIGAPLQIQSRRWRRRSRRSRRQRMRRARVWCGGVTRRRRGRRPASRPRWC